MEQDQLTSLPNNWTLNSLFNIKEKDLLITNLKNALVSLEHKLSKPTLEVDVISSMQHLASSLHQLSSFATCLFAENTRNLESYSMQDISKGLQSQFEKIFHLFEVKLSKLSDNSFETLLKDLNSKAINFYLRERREQVKDKLPLELETLITDLSTDGYHGFSKLYETLLGTLTFTVEGKNLSISQIDNLLHSSSQVEREKAFHVYKEVFSAHENLFAEILNHISGFRLKLYEKRGWNHILDEPLKGNRMKEATLNAMWDSIDNHIQPLCEYLKRKAHLMNMPKLGWLDIDHPLTPTSSLTSYDEAVKLICDEFNHFSPKMAKFSLKAIKNSWVEAEDRPHKYAGGFCISCPDSKESRIFMTYSGSQSSISTLAHELGHAYHNEVLKSLPYFAQDIKMNVAETASTMAEMLLAGGMLAQAKLKETKIALLDDKLSSAVSYLMNIRSRFLFETSFYKERKKGYVDAKRLCELMQNAQEKAYHHLLGEWHPLFWASKIHFYFTEVPFYNFPYTFGYLFSLGIYAKAKQNPKRFEAIFDALLHDTALMNVEDLARHHLQVDLTSSAFWDLALDEIKHDVEQFLELTN